MDRDVSPCRLAKEETSVFSNTNSAHVLKLTAHILMVAQGLRLGHLTTLTDNEYA